MAGVGLNLSGSSSLSRPVVVSPFGRQPFRLSGRAERAFARPISLGFGSSAFLRPGQRRQLGQLDESLAGGADDPTSTFINQGRQFLPSLLPQATAAGAEIANRAPALFNQLTGEISRFLENLPGYQAATRAAGDDLGRAAGLTEESARGLADPVSRSALFQQISGDALRQQRSGLAGRGLLDAGAGQQAEEELLRSLSTDFLLNREGALGQRLALLGDQRQALLGVPEQEARLGALGVDASGAGLDALPDYAAALSSRFQLPFNALAGYLDFLNAIQNPTFSLLQATSPSIGQRSRGRSLGGGASASVAGGG